MTRYLGILACIIGLVAVNVADGQGRGRSGRSGFGVPAVGTMVPEVSLFDENGQPFSTDQLRGKYTVLVFGCLT